MLRKALALASAGALCALLGFVATGCNDATDGMEVFEAVLSPANEVPVRNTAGNGRVQFVSDGTTISYSIEVDDINAVTAAHIHSGAAGVNGPIRVWFFGNGSPTPGGPTTFSDKTILAQGVIRADPVAVVSTAPEAVGGVVGISFADLLNQMRSGTAYVNVHSTQFPGGEMRGQIQLVNVN
jgi:CHRD domain